MKNTLSKLEIDGNFLNLMYRKPAAHTMLNGERQRCPPKMGNLSQYCFSVFSVIDFCS